MYQDGIKELQKCAADWERKHFSPEKTETWYPIHIMPLEAKAVLQRIEMLEYLITLSPSGTGKEEEG